MPVASWVCGAALIIATSIGSVSADGFGSTGNCISGSYPFDSARIYTIPRGTLASGQLYPPVLADIDFSFYDYTIDYAPDQFATDGNTATITVSKLVDANGKLIGSQGTRLSTTRYTLYGRFSVKIKAARPAGLVTTFITMSDRGDEIDWEIVAADPTHAATTNLFYKRVLEYGEHSASLAIPNDGVQDDWHEYSVDWNADRIIWSIDGVALRTETRLSKPIDDGHKDPTIKGEYYYPSTPSVIQIGLWDAGDDPNPGLSGWAGGAVPWGDAMNFTSQFMPLNIQCYDDQGNDVPKWPTSAANKGKSTGPPAVVSTSAAAAQSTAPAKSKQPPAATTDAPSSMGTSNGDTGSSADGGNQPTTTAADGGQTGYKNQPVPTGFTKLMGDKKGGGSAAQALDAGLFRVVVSVVGLLGLFIL